MLVARETEVCRGGENGTGDCAGSSCFGERALCLEKQAKDVSVAERRELRQAQSTPVLAELRRKLLLWKEQLIPKHPMADAVNYTLNQWAQLNVFCSDGTVPIDNNVSTAARGSACRMPTAGLCRAIDHASVPVCFPLVSDAA
jgi:hypothetical protein